MSTARRTRGEVEDALASADIAVVPSMPALAAEVRALWAEREAVLALHQSVRGQGYTDDGYGDVPAACSECGTSDEYAVEWPCSTVRALGGAS